MEKERAKKVIIPSPPAFSPPIPDEFLVGGRTCEVLRILGPAERSINTKTLLERGKSASANMNMLDGEFLFKRRDEIPSIYSQNTFVFPLWTSHAEDVEDDGFIRGFNKKGVDWWCLIKYPNVSGWDSSCRIIRFRNLPLQLPRKTPL